MLIIGITGGIGSGKTAVSDLFKHLGITVIDADIVAREVVEPETSALKQIRLHFGDEVLNTDGSLNRAQLRQRIFSSTTERKWLEALLHPVIRESIVNQLNNAQSPYVILTSPLLLETDQHKLCDQIIVVDVSEDIQVERSCLRDSNSEGQIRKIIAAQMPRSERLDKATHIIDNSGPQSALKLQVDHLHTAFLQQADTPDNSENR